MSERDDLARVLLLAAAHPKVEIEQPVNLCPDDDPPGQPRPTQKVWATDLTLTVEDVLAWAKQVKARAWELGRVAGIDAAQGFIEANLEEFHPDNPYRNT